MATITSTISNVVFSSYDSTLGAYRRVDFTWVLAGATSTAMTMLQDSTLGQEIDVPAVSSPHTGTLTLDYSNMTPTSWDSYAFIPGHTVVFSDIANGYWDGSDTVTGDSSLGVVPAAPAPSEAPKLYGSVNGLSKQIKTLYGSVNGESKEILKLYGSVNGQSKLIYEKVTSIPYGKLFYRVSTSDPTIKSVKLQSVAELGSLVGNGGSGGTWSATVGGGAVTVNSSNSSSKTNFPVGIIIGDTITSIPNNFMQGCPYFTEITIPDTVTSIGNYFLGACTSFNQAFTIPSSVTSIGNDFLYKCTSFNHALSIPSSVTSIGNAFLYNCTSFNQAFTIPSSVTSIGNYFLGACTSFNQDITIPVFPGHSFLYNTDAMVSVVNIGSIAVPSSISYPARWFATTNANAACYTTGIKIAGTNRAAWISRFDNRTSSPYRKLLNAGY